MILRSWPKASLPDDLTRALADKPDSKIEIVVGVVRQDKAPLYDLVVMTSKGEVLFEDVFEVSPWVVARWSVTPGEVMGRGPGLLTLPDVKTANKTVELVLKNGNIAIAGVYTGVADGVLNPYTVTLRPGTVIPVARNGGPMGASLAPLQSSAQFDVSQLILKDLREAILRGLFVDRLGPVESPVKSATEIAIRQQELAEDIGSAFGRIQSEWIGPIVNRCLYIMGRRGLGPKVEVNGRFVKVEHVSPLAMAEKEAEANRVLRWFEMMVSAQVPPEVIMAKVKFEELPGYFARSIGVDMKLLRSMTEQQQIGLAIQTMQKRAQAATEMQAKQQAATAAQQPGGMPVGQQVLQ